MINNKYIKWISICICILIVTSMSVMTGIMAENVFHTEFCEVHNCSLCLLIHISADFFKNIGLVNKYVLILIASLYLISLININIQKVRKLTQVELKVVQIK